MPHTLSYTTSQTRCLAERNKSIHPLQYTRDKEKKREEKRREKKKREVEEERDK